MLKQTAGALVSLTLAAASSGWAATPLPTFQGKSRVLVVSARSTNDPALVRQNEWLQAAEPGLRDRDVVVVRIVGSAVDGPGDLKLDARRLREALGLDVAKFGVALVGKDGSEALRQSEPITMPSLFGAIDAMPMRRQEMKQPRP
jgi:hypothetical protein